MRLSGLLHTDVRKILKEAYKRFFDNNLDMYASALAFQMLFALIPFIIVSIAILSFLDLQEIFQTLYNQADAVVPGDATETIGQFVGDIEQPAGFLIPFAFILALWVASSAMRSISQALNIAYNVKETRSKWAQFFYSVVYTLAIILLLILASLLLIIGPQAVEWLTGFVALDNIFITIWNWLRLPVAIILLITTISFIYFAAPNIRQSYENIVPGAILSVLVWIALSLGFDFYMRTFVNLNILFGSLGAIIFLMIYFYISAAVLLFGAVLNYVIQQQIK